MDRRQQKTRAAIFDAFSALLARKSYSKITVQDIIDEANIGRTTFYAHFETKDELLRSLCEELFAHIIEGARAYDQTGGLYAGGPAGSMFCHLLLHLQENDNNILSLLSCESSELFLRYFKDSLNELIKSRIESRSLQTNPRVPEDFLVNHISGSFVEMIMWWIRGRMQQSPEELDRYFRTVIEPIL